MSNLYFENKDGTEILVCKNAPTVEDGLFKIMINYLDKNYPGREIWYWRGWTKDNITYFDFGSHVEFFYLKGE